MDKGQPKVYDLNEARERIRKYCAYQERSHMQVRQKLESFSLGELATNELLTELIQESFLNEERFARAFVRGRYRQKKWGRRSIIQALRPHQLSELILKNALSEIDEEEYLANLKYLFERKKAAVKDKNPYTRRKKIVDHLLRKGYESDLVWDLIRSEMPLDQ